LDTTREQTSPEATVRPVVFLSQSDQLSAKHHKHLSHGSQQQQQHSSHLQSTIAVKDFPTATSTVTFQAASSIPLSLPRLIDPQN
jgi:hypothetical protein